MPSHSAFQPVFKKSIFDNGLTLVSERLGQFQSLSVGVWVKTGTRHENPNVAGVSHFLEHMLFKGTKNRNALQIARQIDQVGGEFNAFTSREHTCFHILLLGRDISLSLDILIDILMNSQFKEDELERERKVILQEIAMVEESPEELAHDLYFERIFGKSGLGRPILGTGKTVNRMRRKDLVSYFSHHYRPDQLVVSVAGDASHELLRRKIKPLLKPNWPGRPQKNFQQPKPVDYAKMNPGRWWEERPTEQVHLVWGVPGPAYDSPDRFAAFLLNVYLGGGMSSDLFQEIREKNGLAYSVYSTLTPFTDCGVFSIYVATAVNHVPTCLRLIEKSVAKVKEKSLTVQELKAIQENLKGTILLSADSVESRMSSIAKNQIFFGKHFSVDEVCKMVDAVTPDDIQRLAHRLFKDDKRSVLALGPKPSAAVFKKFLGP